MLVSFQSHQELMVDKLQGIEDLLRHRPSSPIPMYEPPEYSHKSAITPISSTEIPHIVLPGKLIGES